MIGHEEHSDRARQRVVGHDPRDILRTIELAADKAGLARIGVHTLRHSAAVAWLEAGVHIRR
jgi:site-specific recombinase XerD